MPQQSIWEKESFFAPQDIIIIGSGFVGLWSAFHLLLIKPTLKISILERGIIPVGASTRNAGFSCFGSPSELLNDSKVLGNDALWHLVEMRYKGLQEIRKYFTDDIIDYDASGGYECFTNDSKDWSECEAALSNLNKELKPITGTANTFAIVDEKLAEFGFNGFDHLIENKLEGGLHPGKLVQALLQKVQSMGAKVFTGIEVTAHRKKDGMMLIETKQEIDFKAKQVLFCTNAFTKQLIPALDIIPCRGQVIITNPIEGLKFKGTFHFDQGYYYFRNLGNRLLIGGARNKDFDEEYTTEMQTSSSIQTELENFIQQHLLPNTNFTITDRWSGIMAMGSEKSPIIKAIDEQVFCCVRMSGMGVALAPEVAKQITRLLLKN